MPLERHFSANSVEMRYSGRISKLNGRGDRIRTCDPLCPRQVRYQAALLPDKKENLFIINKTCRQYFSFHFSVFACEVLTKAIKDVIVIRLIRKPVLRFSGNLVHRQDIHGMAGFFSGMTG